MQNSNKIGMMPSFPGDASVLSESCESLAGVGPALAGKLGKCGIKNVADLLFHLPFRYQDKTRITTIQDLRIQEYAVVVGQIVKIELKQGRRNTLICHVQDKTGVLRLRFFHYNKQQLKTFQENPWIRAFGEVRTFQNLKTMVHPEYQLLDNENHIVVDDTLTPIYPSTEGLSQSRLRQIIKIALTEFPELLTQLEWMSESELQAQGFPPLAEALSLLHNPPCDTPLESLEQAKHPALLRLAFDELLAQQISMQFARSHRHRLSAPILPISPQTTQDFLKRLPFPLTRAQLRVVGEIGDDLARSKPMLRMVQGDVGAGKTLVAAVAALQAINAGYQVAIMAPTDLLSEQHYRNFTTWLSPLGLNCRRLSGKIGLKEKRLILSELHTRACQLVVGTHALFQEEVSFGRLGLIIIDEQHRFGVEQRKALQQKGQTEDSIPHQLLMTATPIPRTLAMTQLAHLDISIIDELPPGRIPVKTAVLAEDKRPEILDRLQAEIAKGTQVYWICTLIEESETEQLRAAVLAHEQLQAELPGIRVGLIHGRMKARDKDDIMAAFQNHELDLLVATTVIEVGVDVPRASVMVIENAERLGLAQLHQLRGRVGRGNTQAYCLLLYKAPLARHSQERLRILRESTDGFVIAEKDLQLRGRGELLGAKQTGYQQFKIADPERDQALFPEVLRFSQELLANSPLRAKSLARQWLGDFEQFLQV